MSLTILEGDCRAILATLPAESVQCVVTSPPYWGLRDYGVEGQLGLEATPEEYLRNMVGVFREVRRMLRGDGVCWVNMGDGYASGEVGRHDHAQAAGICRGATAAGRAAIGVGMHGRQQRAVGTGLPAKNLVGMPWRLAFALQVDGWTLRADCIWAKPNPMPESVRDRPTKAHEYVFLFSKSARYFYDAEAVREPQSESTLYRAQFARTHWRYVKDDGDAHVKPQLGPNRIEGHGRNLRSVWTIPSAPYAEAHFATFPPELARRCILAGTSAKGCCRACGAPWAREISSTESSWARRRRDGDPSRYGMLGSAAPLERSLSDAADRAAGGFGLPRTRTSIGWVPTCAHDAAPVPCTVLDPFAGSGTVGEVAERNGRDAILIELSPAYVDLARARTVQRGLFAGRDACAE